MLGTGKLARFVRKPMPDKWAALKATFGGTPEAREERRLYRLITGRYAPPSVLRANEKLYVAYRPDSDAVFSHHPEIADLSEKYIRGNVRYGAGDLPRLYALILNLKQVLADDVPGDRRG